MAWPLNQAKITEAVHNNLQHQMVMSDPNLGIKFLHDWRNASIRGFWDLHESQAAQHTET